jgi:AbiV family abortive infection protein
MATNNSNKMTNEKYNSLTKEELKEGFELCYESALNHFNVVKSAEEKEIYSIAVSHLVLCAEESIKAIIIAQRILRPEWEINVDFVDLPKVFKKHETKHKELKKVHTVVIDVIEKFYKDFYNLPKAPAIEDKDDELFNIKKKIDIIEKLKQFNYLDLLDKANQYKNKGFYVDYNNGWKSPNEFTVEDYEEFYKLNIYVVALKPISLFIGMI